MGLGAALPLKQRSSSSTATLAPALQQQQKPQRDRRPAAYHPRSEPPEAEQLARGRGQLLGLAAGGREGRADADLLGARLPQRGAALLGGFERERRRAGLDLAAGDGRDGL